MQGQIEMMEEQLRYLKCSYEGWINIVTQATLPEQHQITDSNLQAGLEVPGLVYKEPWRLLTAKEEDPFQQGALKQPWCNSLLRPLKMTLLY